MAERLDKIAQYAMDAFYQNYKSDNDFFDIGDFIFHTGATVGEYLRQEFKQKYDELRADQKDEVVSFSEDWLTAATIPVSKDGKSAPLPPMMSFPYDSQNSGLQDVFCLVPECLEMERTILSALWRLKFVPKSNKVFFAVDGTELKFVSKAEQIPSKISIRYVPTFQNEDDLVPDSIKDFVVGNTASKMFEMSKGKVVKKVLDNNPNKILQTEANIPT